MDVSVFFKNGEERTWGGINHVVEPPNSGKIVLMPHDEGPQESPRIVIIEDEIRGWHEYDLEAGDE